VALVAAATGALSVAARADSNSTLMRASAIVFGGCELASPTALAFGAYSPQGANANTPLDVSPFALSIACTKGVTAQIFLDDGRNFNGARRMVNESNAYLNYLIFTDQSRTTLWAASTTVPYVATTKAPTRLAVYGRIPPGQDVPPSNNYADTVTARVVF